MTAHPAHGAVPPGADLAGRAAGPADVPQRVLETVVPKPGGRLVVVRGPHKRGEGDLIQRENERDRALVQLDTDTEPRWLAMDDICEIVLDG